MQDNLNIYHHVAIATKAKQCCMLTKYDWPVLQPIKRMLCFSLIGCIYCVCVCSNLLARAMKECYQGISWFQFSLKITLILSVFFLGGAVIFGQWKLKNLLYIFFNNCRIKYCLLERSNNYTINQINL